MKKKYQKPIVCVEHYSLTQSIASCTGIKIRANGIPGRADVLADPDATNTMKNLARIGGFLEGGAGCVNNLSSYVDKDGVCYHTNINAAFNS